MALKGSRASDEVAAQPAGGLVREVRWRHAKSAVKAPPPRHAGSSHRAGGLILFPAVSTSCGQSFSPMPSSILTAPSCSCGSAISTSNSLTQFAYAPRQLLTDMIALLRFGWGAQALPTRDYTTQSDTGNHISGRSHPCSSSLQHLRYDLLGKTTDKLLPRSPVESFADRFAPSPRQS